jgi:hypothetical protein
MNWKQEQLLILTKTYPNPSVKYRETTCVAALTADGQMRRIFPVPFRFLDGQQQFKKWEWVNGKVIKAKDDQRPESYKIALDTIQRTGQVIDTKNQ